MAILNNTFEGGVNGGNISTSGSGGASGDAFNTVVINNASTPSGASGITYQSSAALKGSLGARITAAAGTSYLRWDSAEVATRFVARRSLRIAAAPTGNVTVVSIRNTGGIMVDARIEATTNRIYFSVGASDITASRSSSGLSLSTTYWVEIAATKESVGGDGVAEIRLTDALGNVVHTYSTNTASTGLTNASQYRFGGLTAASGWTVDEFDSVRAGALASGWIGPLPNLSPTINAGADQNVAAAATVNLTATAGDSDGSISSYAWAFDYPSSGAPSLTGASTANASFTAGAAGSLYILHCTVTDNEGTTTNDTVEVRVPTSGAFTALPQDGSGVGSWSKVGATTDGGTMADSDDATYMESPDYAGVAATRRVRLQPMLPRSTLNITVRASVTATGGTTVVRLMEGVTQRQQWTLNQNTVATDQVLAVSAPGDIVDWGNLYLEFSVAT